MTAIHRRTFLHGAASMGVAAGVASTLTATRAHAAQSDRLRIGLIGPGGMGTNHLRLLSARADVEVAYVCEVDKQRLEAAAKLAESSSGKAPKAVSDMREVLDDKSIDAVFIATPDHWHAPAAILALDAGKHVYVEKPCCHNIREGRLMAEAVARAGKFLQVGTQTRSTAFVQEAMNRIHAGEIGEILVAKAWNSQRRGSIGKSQPSDPPPHLDYDLWVGPATMVPYRSNMLPGVWRWWRHFGCGDIGNDGVHDIDVACWGLGVTGHPSKATCIGGKYFFDDDQQYPDTQYAVFEYEPAKEGGTKRQLIFEQRIWSPYVQEGYENGAAFYGTKGCLIVGHTVGWKLYGERNKLIAEATGTADLPAHHENFFACIRGQQEKLSADVHAGRLSATLVHLANISALLGRSLDFDPQSEQIVGDEEANALVRREYRDGHFATPKNA